MEEVIKAFGDFNFSLAFAAMGSALGTGIAGMAAIGAWKKAFALKKEAPFILTAFVGAPLTQTFYGWILRDQIKAAVFPAGTTPYMLMMLGLVAGLGMGISAFMQGKAAACAADALAETGEGFAKYMVVIGIIETVALFVMLFCMISLPK